MDERAREIERRAASGDSSAISQLARARIRSGEVPAVLKLPADLEPGDALLTEALEPFVHILCSVPDPLKDHLFLVEIDGLAGEPMGGQNSIMDLGSESALGGVYVIEPENGNLGRLSALQDAWQLRGTPAGSRLDGTPCLETATWQAGVKRYLEVGQPATACFVNDRYEAEIVRRSKSTHVIYAKFRRSGETAFTRRANGEWCARGSRSPYLRFAKAESYLAQEI